MDVLYVTECTDGSIWVRTDSNPNGIERDYPDSMTVEEKMLFAVADFLGFDPEKVICLDKKVSESVISMQAEGRTQRGGSV